MLTEALKKQVTELSGYDKVRLIDYIFDAINKKEDRENLQLWIDESKDRLSAIKKGDLGLVDYSEVKDSIK